MGHDQWKELGQDVDHDIIVLLDVGFHLQYDRNSVIHRGCILWSVIVDHSASAAHMVPDHIKSQSMVPSRILCSQAMNLLGLMIRISGSAFSIFFLSAKAYNAIHYLDRYFSSCGIMR